MRLLAISDLHLGHPANRNALERIGRYPDDWLILAGDTGERPDHLELALEQLGSRFARIVWVPGNHDLWCPPDATGRTRGQDRYDELLRLCRRFGALTPEDPYVEWPAEEGTFLVPMFLLFDYTFRPPEVPSDRAIQWARDGGVLSNDERWLDPRPFASRAAWCRTRCRATQARLDLLPPGARTILINHWPLRYDLARPPRIPRFSLWCGTRATEDWAVRYRARAVISGHLHLRTTLVRDGVRYEEVSLGYPRDWRQALGVDAYLREILPARTGRAPLTPSRDPFA